MLLPSKRTIERHSNNQGSVLGFDMYGTWTRIFIPDAKYRDFTDKRIDTADRELDLNSPLNLCKLGKQICKTCNYLRPLNSSEILTDSELQKTLDSMLDGKSFKDDLSARDGTNQLLTTCTESEAVKYTRTLFFDGLGPCSIPNLYELAVIFLESDQIDQLDPTISDYPDNALGAPVRFSMQDFWTSTQVKFRGKTSMFVLDYLGVTHIVGINYRAIFSVIPVVELV